ncbi:MAG: Trk system potassium transporter TrkA [Halobacteria archaeon]
MRLLVVGAGRIGSSIAENICKNHEVVVLDIDQVRVEDIKHSADVLGVVGDGESIKELQRAEVDKADVVIAATGDDRKNIIICETVNTVTDAFTVATVTETKYLDTWETEPDSFGVDFMVASNKLAADAVVETILVPDGEEVSYFLNGKVLMASLVIGDGSVVDGETVEEADRYGYLSFCGLKGESPSLIPSGDTVLESGEKIVVVGTLESLVEFSGEVVPREKLPSEVVVAGGSQIGREAARTLEDLNISTRLIEEDEDIARRLSEELTDTLVINNDALSKEFLKKENVDDTIVSVSRDDEWNMMVSRLAEDVGAKNTVAVVENPEITEAWNLDGGVSVNPKQVTADEIVRLTLSEKIEEVAFTGTDDKAEVIETMVGEESILSGKDIEESTAMLPDDVVVGAVEREGQLVKPRGDTVIEPGDNVVVFLSSGVRDEVTEKI